MSVVTMWNAETYGVEETVNLWQSGIMARPALNAHVMRARATGRLISESAALAIGITFENRHKAFDLLAAGETVYRSDLLLAVEECKAEGVTDEERFLLDSFATWVMEW